MAALDRVKAVTRVIFWTYLLWLSWFGFILIPWPDENIIKL